MVCYWYKEQMLRGVSIALLYIKKRLFLAKMDKYFREALSNFTYDAACGAAIRHLDDIGYTPEQIKERLDYPATMEQINATLAAYHKKKEEDSKRGASFEFVEEQDEFGRRSFRRKVISK